MIPDVAKPWRLSLGAKVGLTLVFVLVCIVVPYGVFAYNNREAL
jgi:hypothetical protein